MSRCRACGAILSKYRPDGTVFCAPHEPAHITHHDYTASITYLPPVPVDEKCRRGHDLRVHGRLKNTGGGRVSRKCNACATERQRAYRSRSAA